MIRTRKVFFAAASSLVYILLFNYANRHELIPSFVLTLVSLPGLAGCWFLGWFLAGYRRAQVMDDRVPQRKLAGKMLMSDEELRHTERVREYLKRKQGVPEKF